ncbi:hypothetical protein C7974DRAFT_56900 [Boeremia exigua]|uniref:uncharacterized protein n=1 Tax=Boeremia exigua TaxID=749465 RepID=UPI001E8D270C|nr:uncharacterized protein C7974DRAFT_56900 [Boeremia exigua]KAH6614982.1 hypothetical protein C7974DRAFT_56900 [Boeremia exigua]
MEGGKPQQSAWLGAPSWVCASALLSTGCFALLSSSPPRLPRWRGVSPPGRQDRRRDPEHVAPQYRLFSTGCGHDTAKPCAHAHHSQLQILPSVLPDERQETDIAGSSSGSACIRVALTVWVADTVQSNLTSTHRPLLHILPSVLPDDRQRRPAGLSFGGTHRKLSPTVASGVARWVLRCDQRWVVPVQALLAGSTSVLRRWLRRTRRWVSG